jgi:hypothetical protein
MIAESVDKSDVKVLPTFEQYVVQLRRTIHLSPSFYASFKKNKPTARDMRNYRDSQRIARLASLIFDSMTTQDRV